MKSIVLFLIMGLMPVSAAGEKPDPKPNELIRRVLFYPHGFTVLPKGEREVLERVQRNPEPYVEHIKARYGRTNVVKLATQPKTAGEFRRICELLGVLASESASDLLARWFVELDRAVSKAPSSVLQTNLAGTRGVILGALLEGPTIYSFREQLRPIRNKEVREQILGNMHKIPREFRGAGLGYLRYAYKDDPTVIPRLRALVEKQEAPLFGDEEFKQQLAEVIKNWDSPAQ